MRGMLLHIGKRLRV